MSRYIIGRIGQTLLVLWIAFTASFLLLQALPGDAILIKFQNPELGLGPEQIAALRDAYGVDSPLWQQYLQALGNFLTGNFGYSVVGSVPVAHELLTNLPATARLASLGFTLAVLIALGLAFLATLAPFAWLRTAIQSIPSLFVSLPVFWLGIMLIQIFSFRLKWISVINPGEFEGLILPVITLAIPISAPLAQILIRNIDEVSTQPFVAVARAKGASPSWVLWRHVVKNALLPTLTIAGILFGELLAGAVITETVFGLNGIGGLTERSVRFQDTSVIQAIVVFSALCFVAVNLAVDLLYPVFDPRLRRLKGAPA
ncbi:ABC transporter permease [Devosia sp. Root105]|uniref:ABC transporter permease n=1 Tax=Devosia sp. Root105 TaxID=1736423 RepID=UPI0006FE014D|nr:ABC transporter permease [Devosia sp. Root105]KQU95799.1 peptide ABC transporter permease [Devosia sp. Root105]